MDWVEEWLINHVMSLEILAKKTTKSKQIPPDVLWGGDVKSSQKDSTKIPDIFFSAPVSPSNSTLYTVYCY